MHCCAGLPHAAEELQDPGRGPAVQPGEPASLWQPGMYADLMSLASHHTPHTTSSHHIPHTTSLTPHLLYYIPHTMHTTPLTPHHTLTPHPSHHIPHATPLTPHHTLTPHHALCPGLLLHCRCLWSCMDRTREQATRPSAWRS